MLWLSTSGRAAKTVSSDAGSPLQSEMSTSTRASGDRLRMAWMVAANAPAPPSGRSSRATQVTTAYDSPMRATASATCSGSAGSSASGLLVSTRQKPQALVHRSPLIMKVPVPSAQHSKMLGQPASSHTVVRSRSRMVCLSLRYSGVMRTLARAHSGLRAAIWSPSVTPASERRA